MSSRKSWMVSIRRSFSSVARISAASCGESSTHSPAKRGASRFLRVTATPAETPPHESPLRPLGISVRTTVVPPAPLLSPFQAYAADFARRFAIILAALAALIARRCLREPRLLLLGVPLWNRLNRTARRFERLIARLAAGRLPKPRAPGRRGGPRRADPLPTGKGWLIRVLGYEAAGYASQLQALLTEPGAAGLLAQVPTAQRILNPLSRLLAIGVFTFHQRPRPARAAPVAAAPPGDFQPLGPVVGRSPGFTWYLVPTPPANPA